MSRFILRLIVLLAITSIAHAQQKYWIYPKDKMEVSGLKRHAEELCLSPIVISEWLGAYSVVLNNQKVQNLRKNTQLVVEKINARVKINANSHSINLAKALSQIHADTLIRLGLSGKGIKIGIIDAGFLRADEDKYLKEIIESERILGYKNYIEQETMEPYSGDGSNNDYHGTNVFGFIAGKSKNNHIGLASGAEFYLARTDQADKEYHGEEDFWIAALEWMHSQGVRLVNSSLGYSDGFDDPTTDYKKEHVDGKFSAITRAAEIAIKEKGMTIVLSAGNDGNKDFEIISIPADAEGIISVGASGYKYWNKLSYSSIGPETLRAVKPEVSCYAAAGTSFSAPIITGLVACIKEMKPDITNGEILTILKRSSHLYPHPNNYLGYGVPNAHKILQLMDSSDYEFGNSHLIEANDSISISLPKSYNIMAFHKKDEYVVQNQEKIRWDKGEVHITRAEGIAYTTVATDSLVWEIKWIDD